MFSTRSSWNLAPTRFAEAVERHRRSGRELLDLTESNPTRVGLEYDRQAILQALAAPAALVYEPDPRGLLAARQAVAAYYAARGLALDAGRILLTTSTSEAYSFAFRLLCEPGDEVLVPRPSYPLFEYLAALADVRLIHYPLVYHDGWQIDLHALEAAISSRTRALLVVHPNNPTGSFVKADETAQVVALCARRELAVVADEVFVDYAHDGAARPSFAGVEGALTFTLSGLSKLAALPQMKVAWMVVGGPERLRAEALARLEVIADTYLSMNAPVQHALPALLAQAKTIHPQLLTRIRQNLVELDGQLAAQTLVARLATEGGWYAVLRVPALGSDEDLAIALLERAGVLVHPGHFYDFDRDGYLVVSLIVAPKVLQEGIRRTLHVMQGLATDH